MVPEYQKPVPEQKVSDAVAAADAAALAAVAEAETASQVRQERLRPVKWDVFCPPEMACC